jgi:hypothetical protein
VPEPNSPGTLSPQDPKKGSAVPNWVFNTVTVEGDEQALTALADTLAVAPGPDGEAVPFSFQAVIPRPAEAEGDWYNWNTANWGTKWDAHAPALDPDSGPGEGWLCYRFETAWSYPEPVFAELTRTFPQLHFTFAFQEEQGWGGTFEGVGGRLELTDSYDVPQSHTEMLERGHSCYCEVDEPVFPDCWSAAALVAGVSDPVALEVIEGLSGSWRLGVPELIAAVQDACLDDGATW